MSPMEKQRLHLQSIIDKTANEYGIPSKTLQITKRRQAGVCRKKYIRIAEWTLLEPEAMQLYLVLHEIAHDIAEWRNRHNGYFREIEEKVLRSWGITAVNRPNKYIKAVEMNGSWHTWNHLLGL